MLIKFFVRPGCPKCPPSKALAKKLKEEGVPTKIYNLEEADGLAEGALYGVMSTPTVIIVNEKDEEVISWRGETPSENEIKKYLE